MNAKTYRVTRRHVRGSRIVRELVASGFEYRESAADHITTVIGRPVYPDRYPDGDIAGPDGVWFTVDAERQPRNQQVSGGDPS